MTRTWRIDYMIEATGNIWPYIDIAPEDEDRGVFIVPFKGEIQDITNDERVADLVALTDEIMNLPRKENLPRRREFEKLALSKSRLFRNR